MLVYKDGDTQKDILGFRCDLCDCVTLTDVVPNKHGEFRYICPKCGHKMKELPENKEEETKMVNTYTISNAAKRLNCGRATVARAIYDGRFHDCFMEAGYNGRPAWMIPSDQVEEWVTKGGFVQPGKKIKKASAEASKKEPRKVFDPEVGKEVPVVDLLGDIEKEPEAPFDPAFAKRAVRRVAKPQQNKKYTKVLDRSKEARSIPNPLYGMPEVEDAVYNPRPSDASSNIVAERYPHGGYCEFTDASNEVVTERDANGKPIAGRYPWGDPMMSPTAVTLGGDTDGDSFVFSKPQPVVRTDAGFTITFPTEMVEEMVQKQVKNELAGPVSQLRAALDMLDKELKKLEEAIA